MKPLILLLAVAISASSYGMSGQPKRQLVYVQQPRLAEQFENSHHAYDGGLPDRHTKTSVILEDLDTKIRKVIHDCVSDENAICSPQEPRVSPDATKILYTLAEGDQLFPITAAGYNDATGKYIKGPTTTEKVEFTGARYSLWLYTIATGKTVKLYDDARMGDWYNDNSIVFASRRDRIFTPLAHAGQEPGYTGYALQIYIADITKAGDSLTNLLNLSPESVGASSPALLHDGRVCWSDYNGFGQRGVSHTPSNQLWIKCANSDGTDSMYMLGAHGSPTFKMYELAMDVIDPARKGEGSTQLRLLRGIVAMRDNKWCVVSYYRSNHRGKNGSLWCADQLPPGIEGYSQSRWIAGVDYPSAQWASGRFTPQLFAVTPTAQDQDMNWPKFDKQNRALGKFGDPAPLPEGEGKMLAVWARGACYEFMEPSRSTREAMGGEPTCQSQPVRFLVDRVTNPFDPKQVEVLACKGDTENCYDARWVATRNVLVGDEPPKRLPRPPKEGFTTLQIVDARAAELEWIPSDRHPHIKEQDKVSFSGNRAAAYPQLVTAIRIEEILPWKGKATKTQRDPEQCKWMPKGCEWEYFNVGRVWDLPLYADGSVKGTIPAGIVYRLSGIDKDGSIVAMDNSLHHATGGEVVTCHGCHDGHSVERSAWLKGSAVERFGKTEAGK